ncbi:protein pufQ [Sulfitobacter sp. BDSS02]|uniref:cytochrome PufQ n=1 Tax=Heliomarina sp. TaxID=2917556 RepID=UPI00405A308B|nr:protein pufQ [Sulfitobacter sp. BDSS02]MBR9849606.1 protein pufQ [Paracoccaceae bacterium]
MTMNSNVSRDPHFRAQRAERFEYRLYFTLIFLLALPFSTVEWMLCIKRQRTLNLRGPLARAWLEADRITPVIFSA